MPGTCLTPGMGNAGIVRELLSFGRVRTGGEPSHAVTWPDHPPVSSA